MRHPLRYSEPDWLREQDQAESRSITTELGSQWKDDDGLRGLTVTREGEKSGQGGGHQHVK